MMQMFLKDQKNTGTQLSRSFSNEPRQSSRRASSAPPRFRGNENPNFYQRNKNVPWIPNASQSNHCYNTITRKFYKERLKIISYENSPSPSTVEHPYRNSRKPRLHHQPVNPLLSSFTQSSAPSIVETFIGGRKQVYKVNSPFHSPLTSPTAAAAVKKLPQSANPSQRIRAFSEEADNTRNVDVAALFGSSSNAGSQLNRKFTLTKKVDLKDSTKSEYDQLISQLHFSKIQPRPTENKEVISQPTKLKEQITVPPVISTLLPTEENHIPPPPKVEPNLSDLSVLLNESPIRVEDSTLSPLSVEKNLVEQRPFPPFDSSPSPALPRPVPSASPKLKIITSPPKAVSEEALFDDFFQDETNNYDLNDQPYKKSTERKVNQTKPLRSPNQQLQLKGTPESKIIKQSSFERTSSSSFDENDPSPRNQKLKVNPVDAVLKKEVVPPYWPKNLSLDESFDEFFDDNGNNAKVNDQHPSSLRRNQSRNIGKQKSPKPVIKAEKKKKKTRGIGNDILETEKKYFEERFGKIDFEEEDGEEAEEEQKGQKKEREGEDSDEESDLFQNLQRMEKVERTPSKKSFSRTESLDAAAIAAKLNQMQEELNDWWKQIQSKAESKPFKSSSSVQSLNPAIKALYH